MFNWELRGIMRDIDKFTFNPYDGGVFIKEDFLNKALIWLREIGFHVELADKNMGVFRVLHEGITYKIKFIGNLAGGLDVETMLVVMGDLACEYNKVLITTSKLTDRAIRMAGDASIEVIDATILEGINYFALMRLDGKSVVYNKNRDKFIGKLISNIEKTIDEEGV